MRGKSAAGQLETLGARGILRSANTRVIAPTSRARWLRQKAFASLAANASAILSWDRWFGEREIDWQIGGDATRRAARGGERREGEERGADSFFTIKGLAGRIKWLRGGVETERANPLLLGPKTSITLRKV